MYEMFIGIGWFCEYILLGESCGLVLRVGFAGSVGVFWIIGIMTSVLSFLSILGLCFSV